MGKTLLELLDTFSFDPTLNPNKEKKGMLKPEPSDRNANDNKQAKEWLKATPKLYGTDIVRILSETDPHEAKKAIKKGADKVGGALAGLGGVGLLIGGAISAVGAFHPKFPDDWTVGEDGKPTGMERNFYKGLVNGDYAFGKRYNPYHSNNKSKLGNFLAGNKTPDQAANALVPSIKSAVVGLAVAGIGLGIAALFSKSKKNKKKGKEGPAKPKPKPKQPTGFFVKDKNGMPYFPSTLLINAGWTDAGYKLSYRNYSRLSAVQGNIAKLDYLKDSAADIIRNLSPTIDDSKVPDAGKDTSHGLSEYYTNVFQNNTPQTRNEGNVMVSAHMFQNNWSPNSPLENIDAVTGWYTQFRNDYGKDRALDSKIENYSRLVDKEGTAYIAPGYKTDTGEYTENDVEKSATLSLRHGASGTNLLSIKLAKEGDSPKINYVTNDAGDIKYTWSPTDSSYTKDFIVDKKNSEYIQGDKYANEVTPANDLITQNGGLSQNFGVSETNLIKIVNGENDYTFDVKTDDGSNKLIAKIHAGEAYSYTNSEVKINTLTTDEQSRFISGGIADIGESKLIKGYGGKDVETQIGQQFGDAFISVDIDTKKEEEYKYPFRTIGQMDTVARWNTKDANFSSKIDTIMTNSGKVITNALQTQTNTSKNINPYLHNKRDILKSIEGVKDVIKVSINGINFISTISNLSDKSAASWDSVKPIGSGVNFYLYNSWERDISFDLKLYADNPTQLDQIWKKVNAVTALTRGKPTNTKKGVFGRIVGLELGDLISVEGFVSDITMNVDDAAPWDIKPGAQAPMICSISVSFKVVTNGDATGYTFYNTLKA